MVHVAPSSCGAREGEFCHATHRRRVNHRHPRDGVRDLGNPFERPDGRRTPRALRPTATLGVAREKRFSGTTPSATSNSGPTCCGCTRSFPTVDPATALAVGLKVDVEALPSEVIAALLRRTELDLADPAVTVELLRLNAVVGVKGTVNEAWSAHDRSV